jgi:hypothetical protein
MGKQPATTIPLLLWCSSSNKRALPITTVVHVAHARLLLAPIAVTLTLTLLDHCYCGAHGMHVGDTSTHSSNGPSDINEPLLLPPTIATGNMTQTIVVTIGNMARTGATSAHRVTSHLTLVDRCCYHQQ